MGSGQEKVKNLWRRHEEVLGYTDPSHIADDPEVLTFPLSRQKIERAFSHMPMQEHLYPGAIDTVRALLHSESKDFIIIWTHGKPDVQVLKVENSGLGKLSEELPPPDKKRFAIDASFDKMSKFPSTLEHVTNTLGLTTLLIIDDKAGNIDKVARMVQKAKDESTIPQETHVEYIWINQGRVKDQVPDGHTLESFSQQYRTISDIRELVEIKKEDDFRQTVGWLIDLDHTLINTTSAREALFVTLGSEIDNLSQK